MQKHQLVQAVAGAAFMLATASASAQYVWIDAKGSRNYSDRPPPPGVPAHKILKAPSGMEQLMAAAKEPAPPAPEAVSAKEALATREEESRKRRQESAENAKKAQEAARLAAEKKQQCDSARASKAQLESGMRLRSQNAADPRAVMGDEERAAALARTNQALASCR